MTKFSVMTLQEKLKIDLDTLLYLFIISFFTIYILLSNDLNNKYIRIIAVILSIAGGNGATKLFIQRVKNIDYLIMSFGMTILFSGLVYVEQLFWTMGFSSPSNINIFWWGLLLILSNYISRFLSSYYLKILNIITIFLIFLLLIEIHHYFFGMFDTIKDFDFLMINMIICVFSYMVFFYFNMKISNFDDFFKVFGWAIFIIHIVILVSLFFVACFLPL